MSTTDLVLLTLDLIGTFAFALNGALTAVRTVRLDIVGVITLAARRTCYRHNFQPSSFEILATAG